MKLEEAATEQRLEADANDLAAQIQLSDQQYEITRLREKLQLSSNTKL